MYTELSFEDDARCIQVVMEASIQRENEDLQRILKLYLDNKLDPMIRDRVEFILKNNKLIMNGAPTSEGERLIKTGMFSAMEYGQYRVTSANNDFTDSEDAYLTLIRENSSAVENSKKSSLKIHADLFDCDQEKMVHVDGTCLRMKEDKPISVEFRVISEDEEVKCKVTSKIDSKSIVTDVEPTMDIHHLLEKCLRNYSIPRKAIVIEDLSLLDAEQSATLSANFSEKDIGRMVSSDIFDRPFKSFHSENIPLCASDERIAGQWMSELRKYWWKDEFVSVKRAKFDQEYWSERIMGKNLKGLVKADDELLSELSGSDAYWGVASMIDLMPDSEYRMPFFITPDSDFSGEIRSNIFSDEQMSDLKKIVVVDSYPGSDSEQVIRKWIGNESLHIVFVVNGSRYDGSRGRKLEERDLSENAELIVDERKKSEAHSRYLILVKKNNEMTVWNMDNSIGQFHIIDDKVETRTKMKFTPEPCIYDKEVEKIVRGLK